MPLLERCHKHGSAAELGGRRVRVGTGCEAPLAWPCVTLGEEPLRSRDRPSRVSRAAFLVLATLFAAIRLTNALLPALRESKVGAIVNISSGAATMAVGAVAHYAAAKAALNSYSRALAIDLAPSKIRVNLVSPGPVTTPGSRAFSDAMGAPPDLFAKEIPLGRYGSPADLAEVVALLVSDRANWMTGGNIHVDGGMSAR